MKKIYIAGPITIDPDGYELNFKLAQEFLENMGYAVINPATFPEGLTYNDYINIGLIKLSCCDCIAMLPNWDKSKGAKLEHSYAEVTNLPILYF